MTTHLPAVAPNLAPGGIWVRVCTDDEELLTEYALMSVSTVEISADVDVALALDRADQRRVIVRTYLYDGDTGECLKTIIAKPTIR